MDYFKNENDDVFAYNEDQVTSGLSKGLIEIISPFFNGKVLKNHKNIGQLSTKGDGTVYSHYLDNADDTGIFHPNLAEIKKLAIDEMIIKGEYIAKTHIQEPIIDYNKVNCTKFANAHSCANYKDEDNYIHQPFCLAVWKFNVEVWKVVDTVRKQIENGNIKNLTTDGFISMLPVFEEI